MYCAKCGAQVAESSSFCGKCGAPVSQPTAPPQPAVVSPPSSATAPQTPTPSTQTSGFAVASLVCGIVGLLINFLSIPAIVLGAIGIAQTGKNSKYKGRGMAVAGLVLGIFTIIFWIVIIVLWAGSSFWWFSNF